MQPVNVRGLRIGEGMPKICIPLTSARTSQLCLDAEVAAQQADMLEWRLDCFDEGGIDTVCAAADLLRQRVRCPLLVTFRTAKEGGERSILAGGYAGLYSALLLRQVADLIDIELTQEEEVIRTLIEQAHAAGAKVIISSHDFDQTPALEEMCSPLQRMEALGGDIAKLAVMPNDELDVLRLMEASLRADRQMQIPLITMWIEGSLGMLSRIGGELIHSAVTFASVGKRSAPGQPDAAEARAALAIAARDALRENSCLSRQTKHCRMNTAGLIGRRRFGCFGSLKRKV